MENFNQNLEAPVRSTPEPEAVSPDVERLSIADQEKIDHVYELIQPLDQLFLEKVDGRGFTAQEIVEHDIDFNELFQLTDREKTMMQAAGTILEGFRRDNLLLYLRLVPMLSSPILRFIILQNAITEVSRLTVEGSSVVVTRQIFRQSLEHAEIDLPARKFLLTALDDSIGWTQREIRVKELHDSLDELLGQPNYDVMVALNLYAEMINSDETDSTFYVFIEFSYKLEQPFLTKFTELLSSSEASAKDFLKSLPRAFLMHQTRKGRQIQNYFEVVYSSAPGSSADDKRRYLKNNWGDFPELLLSFKPGETTVFNEEDTYELAKKLIGQSSGAKILSDLPPQRFSAIRLPEMKGALISSYLQENGQMLLDNFKTFESEFRALPLEKRHDFLRKVIPISPEVIIKQINNFIIEPEDTQVAINFFLSRRESTEVLVREHRQLGLSEQRFYELLISSDPYRAANFLVQEIRTADNKMAIRAARTKLVTAGDFTSRFIQFADTAVYKLVLSESSWQLLSEGLRDYVDPLTNNDHDKISPFFSYLAKSSRNFNLSDAGIRDALDYIKNFGLERADKLFDYFVNIKQVERQELKALPPEQAEQELVSVEALMQRQFAMKEMIISGAVPRFGEMSDFDYDMLGAAAMFSTSRWAREQKSLRGMHRDFQAHYDLQHIAPLPEYYRPSELHVAKVKTNFDLVEYAAPEYFRYAADLSSAAEINRIGVGDLINKVSARWRVEAERTAEHLEGAPAARVQAIQKKKQILFSAAEYLSWAPNANEVFSIILNVEKQLNISRENDFTTPYLRQLLYARVMAKHSNYNTLPTNILKQEAVSPEALQFIRDITQNVVKEHLLTLSEGESYWGDGWRPTEKDLRHLKKIFPMPRTLKVLRHSEIALADKPETVGVFPDRGFMGELSGYYSEACYTRLSDMLATWPNVIPLKLVLNSEDELKREIMGGVLLIESRAEDGDKVIILRAINPRDEFLKTLSAGSFCEQLFSVVSDYARSAGARKVLVATMTGSVSNREKINSYIVEKYKEAPRIPLQEKVDFNGYDITNECALVMELL